MSELVSRLYKQKMLCMLSKKCTWSQPKRFKKVLFFLKRAPRPQDVFTYTPFINNAFSIFHIQTSIADKLVKQMEIQLLQLDWRWKLNYIRKYFRRSLISCFHSTLRFGLTIGKCRNPTEQTLEFSGKKILARLEHFFARSWLSFLLWDNLRPPSSSDPPSPLIFSSGPLSFLQND